MECSHGTRCMNSMNYKGICYRFWKKIISMAISAVTHMNWVTLSTKGWCFLLVEGELAFLYVICTTVGGQNSTSSHNSQWIEHGYQKKKRTVSAPDLQFRAVSLGFIAVTITPHYLNFSYYNENVSEILHFISDIDNFLKRDISYLVKDITQLKIPIRVI